MSDKKSKKLTLSTMKQTVSSKYDEKNRIEFADGFVDVDKYFRPTKIALAVDELKDAMLNSNIVNAYPLFLIYLLKNFTSLEIPSEQEKQVVYFNLLIDGEYLKDILAAFDQEELKKFNEQVKQAGIALNQMREEFLRIEAENKEALENA